MTQSIRFENHLAKRVVEVFFDDGFTIKGADDLSALKAAWTDNLKKWHSPYTCVFDCRNLEIQPCQAADFDRMIEFFKKFFMKKIIGFTSPEGKKDHSLPFEVFPDYETALAGTGLGRSGGLARDLGKLRDRIQVDNDFSAHVMEISFLAATTFENKEDLATLRDKLQNILVQWHTPYSVVFNVENCTFSSAAKTEFASLERFLRAFFCRALVGYGPVTDKEAYPFPVYRSRHKAVGTLENQGLQGGDTANCSTRRTKKT